MTDDNKHATNKVGLLPYRRIGERVEFLIYLPKAKADEEQPDVNWGLARGTVRDTQGNDIRDASTLTSIPAEQIEDHWQTALAEGREELGILPENIDATTIVDHGLITYESNNKGPYPIHFYSMALRPGYSTDQALTSPDLANDAAGLCWTDMRTLEEMVHNGTFKRSYLDIVCELAERLPPPRFNPH